jgi:hypothetical protein
MGTRRHVLWLILSAVICSCKADPSLLLEEEQGRYNLSFPTQFVFHSGIGNVP